MVEHLETLRWDKLSVVLALHERCARREVTQVVLEALSTDLSDISVAQLTDTCLSCTCQSKQTRHELGIHLWLRQELRAHLFEHLKGSRIFY